MTASIETLSLQEVAAALGYKDGRTARRWCRMHHVAVFTDAGAKKPYVLKIEFDAVRSKKLIEYVQKKYDAQHWQKALEAILSGNTEQLCLLEIKGTKSTRIPQKKVTILGKEATRFFSELNDSVSG